MSEIREFTRDRGVALLLAALIVLLIILAAIVVVGVIKAPLAGLILGGFIVLWLLVYAILRRWGRDEGGDSKVS